MRRTLEDLLREDDRRLYDDETDNEYEAMAEWERIKQEARPIGFSRRGVDRIMEAQGT